MQFSLVISHCNITFLLFRLSQGSVATLIRWGGWSSYCHMYRSSLILTVKTALKSVDFSRSDRQKIGSVFTAHGVVAVSQTLRRWTEGATCIRYGGHHVGHWPTFVVVFCTHFVPERSHEKAFPSLPYANQESFMIRKLRWRSFVPPSAIPAGLK